MLRLALSALALVLGFSAAKAAVVWQGEAVIDTSTGQCSAEQSIAPAQGRVLRTVLRPLNLSDNGANTTITFIANQTAMFAMVLDRGAMPSGVAAVFGHDASGVIKANVGVPYSNFIQSPAVIATSTAEATLQGRIENFLYIEGCTVTFRAAYTKRND